MPGIRLAALVRRLRRDAAPDAGECADAVLVARFAATRDEAAFELLVRRHGAMVLATCRRVLGHTEDAEDAFQAAFLVLACKAAHVRRGTAVPAWLHRVAVRIARRAANRRRPTSVLVSEPPARHTPDAAEQSELRGLLDAEIDRLSEPFRQVFVLCYLEGLSNADAARVLGCPVGTVESRLTTARRTLRDRLGRRVELPAGVLALLACPPVLPADTVTTLTRVGVIAAQRGLRAAIGLVREPTVEMAELGVRAMAKTLRTWMAVLLGVSLLGLAASVGWANRHDEPPTEPAVAAEATEQPPAAPMPKPVDQSATKGEAWPKAKELALNSDLTLFGVAHDGKTLLFRTNKSVTNVTLVGWQRVINIRSQNLISAAALSPDGKYVATAEFANGVKLRDAATGKIVEALWPKDAIPAYEVAFTPDGAKLVALCTQVKDVSTATGVGGLFTCISVWDLTTRKEVGYSTSKDRYDGFPHYALAEQGQFVVKTDWIQDKDRRDGPKSLRLTIMDVLTGKERNSFEVPLETFGRNSPRQLAPDGKTFALCDKTLSKIHFFNTETGKERFPAVAFRRRISRVVFSPDGRFVAAATGELTNNGSEPIAAPSEVVIWDAATGRELARMTDKETIRNYSALAFSPDGSFLVTGAKLESELKITIWGHLPAEPAPTKPVAKNPDTGHTKPAAKAPDTDAVPARFQALIRDLSGAGVTDARRVEALFLAVLGRLPTEVETRMLTAHLAKREDKAAALADLLNTLTETTEFRAHAEELRRMVK